MLIVQKYGGTSVADIERIRNVARLLTLAHQIQDDDNDREVDVIVSTGEQVTVGLLALAIRALGGDAQSFLGHQVRILTDSAHSRARIRSIDSGAISECFRAGKIAVIAGFQGIDEHGNITTLGRGGSDTTAVAIAAALKADACEIYTDVDGVYTTDPRIVPGARKIDRVCYEEMLELASLGAKVLQIRSVEFGMKYAVPIHVRSSFHGEPGTWVVPEDKLMENVVVSGVTMVRDEAKITVHGVPDVAGVAARLFRPLAQAGIVVDMIIQNVSSEGITDLTFTVPMADRKRSLDILLGEAGDLCSAEQLAYDDDIAKVSVVGVGMRSHSGVASRMFELLAAEGINIRMISTSEIKISCVIEEKYAELAVRTLHQGFGLHLPAAERPSP
jgi:aspartate kinase